MDAPRVVVTGVGVVSPLGIGAEATWSAMKEGKSGVRRITQFDATDYACQVGAEVRNADEGGFDPLPLLGPKDVRKMDRFIQMGMVATAEALAQAGLTDAPEELRERIGVYMGAGIGGLPLIEEAYKTLAEKGPRRISPFFIPAVLINLLPGQVSIRWGFKGPSFSHVSACATGAHSVGEAYDAIRLGKADIMVAGGAEAAISPLGVGGFVACRALSTGYNDRPEKASRPFDRDRDGFVIAEGAAVLILEREDVARKRGAAILGEIIGYGASSDAHHLTMPAPGAEGAQRAVRAALKSAGIAPDAVGYVNAHATSTPAGDEQESMGIEAVFGKDIKVSATKSMTGHLLGAAGALETIVCLMALRDGVLPPTINLDNPSENCRLDYIPHTAREAKINIALNNSFGFGGTNAALLLKKV